MDPIKILLTLFLALCSALMGLLLLAPLIGVVVTIQSGDVVPGGLIFGATAGTVCAVLFAAGAFLLARSAWRQLSRRGSTREADMDDVRKSLQSGSLDISRITGVGWLLGIASATLPVLLFLFVAQLFDVNITRGVMRVAGPALLVLAAAFFFIGRALLTSMGIGVIRTPVRRRKRRPRSR